MSWCETELVVWMWVVGPSYTTGTTSSGCTGLILTPGSTHGEERVFYKSYMCKVMCIQTILEFKQF